MEDLDRLQIPDAFLQVIPLSFHVIYTKKIEENNSQRGQYYIPSLSSAVVPSLGGSKPISRI
tara:strand:+ start:1070 stop:1255 length:186 start_codon:yes stop_codon:yes gene_type:complete